MTLLRTHSPDHHFITQIVASEQHCSHPRVEREGVQVLVDFAWQVEQESCLSQFRSIPKVGIPVLE